MTTCSHFFSGQDDSVMAYITFSVADTSLLVCKINFIVADITFKVAMITSAVVMITLVVSEITFKVDVITYLVVNSGLDHFQSVCDRFFSGQDQFCSD